MCHLHLCWAQNTLSSLSTGWASLNEYKYPIFWDAAPTLIPTPGKVSESVFYSFPLIHSDAQRCLWDVIHQMYVRTIKNHSGPKTWHPGLLPGWSIISLFQLWVLTPLPSLAHRLQYIPTKSNLQPLRLPCLSPANVNQAPHSANPLPILVSACQSLSYQIKHVSFLFHLSFENLTFFTFLHCLLDWDVLHIKN